MSRISVWEGAVAGLAGAVGVTVTTAAGLLAGGLAFPPFDLFDWEARILPGAVVNFTVDAIVRVVTNLGVGPTDSVAKIVEHAVAVTQFLALGAVVGILLVLWRRRGGGPSPTTGMVLGGATGVVLARIERSLAPDASWLLDAAWLALVFAAWGGLTGLWLRAAARPGTEAVTADPGADTVRRRIVYWTGLAGAAAGLGILASLFLRRSPARVPASAAGAPSSPNPSPYPPTSGPAASPPREVLESRPLPASGTRPEITPPTQFYRVDIDSLPPTLDAASWRLRVGGVVAKELSLTLGDLHGLPSITQAITLSCISNPVGGSLISTGYVTGVPIKHLIGLARPQPTVTALNMRCADGFYESMSLATAMDERTLLVYALDGAPLPAEHGFPVRVYIPDRYGMKQPKWITEIELATQPITGYWVERGWDREARVRTTSVIDTPRGTIRAQGEPVTLGGIAYAGAKGISKVEVRVDTGPWRAATLRVPPLSALTWVQWKTELPLAPGPHTLSVRAWDGEGRLQRNEESDSFPAGATGLFSRAVRVHADGKAPLA